MAIIGHDPHFVATKGAPCALDDGPEAERLNSDPVVLRAAIDNMRHGFLLLDDRWRVKDFNPRVIELLGYSKASVRVGTSAYELVREAVTLGHYCDRSVEDAYALWHQRLSDRVRSTHRTKLVDNRTLGVTYAPFGEGGWIITYEDITARATAEAALAEQKDRLDIALRNMPHGVCMFDDDRRLILCNAGYRALYALPDELTLPGTPLQAILDYRSRTGSGPVEMGTYFDVADEADRLGRSRTARVHLQDGRAIRIAHNPMSGKSYIATHEDITEAVRAEERIAFMGSHDALTELPNRRLLGERIGEALARGRQGGILAVHCLDLDNFKAVNDLHGHKIGDLLLKQAAERLKLCLGEMDTLARLGGDEFVLLQTGLKRPEDAGAMARHVIDILSTPFDLDGEQVFLGVSIGIAVSPDDGLDTDTLLRNADTAMSRSKADGNTYSYFQHQMDARLQERRILELDLRRAVANNEFELYYQLQVDAQTEAVKGCEALIRWHHPARGLVSPDAFIPVAEETGIIVPLGAWILRQACLDASAWPSDVSVAVNVSPAQFKGFSLVRTVLAALDESGIAPSRLELEITESALLVDSEGTLATLNHLRTLGVRIALDDFGTGYSSLSYLRSFPFDKIKIDRCFIRDLGEKGDCTAIVKAMAGLGAALGMKTTAEGVETTEQLQHIREQGCTEVQGYFFGRPCPANEVLKRFSPLRATG